MCHVSCLRIKKKNRQQANERKNARETIVLATCVRFVSSRCHHLIDNLYLLLLDGKEYPGKMYSVWLYRNDKNSLPKPKKSLQQLFYYRVCVCVCIIKENSRSSALRLSKTHKYGYINLFQYYMNYYLNKEIQAHTTTTCEHHFK